MTTNIMEEYERVVIRAVLTGSNELWSEAHVISCVHDFTTEKIKQCHLNVERWLRLHGVSRMFPNEKKSLILIQSTVRRWLVLKKIQQQMNMYTRLANIDSPDHSKRALTLQRTLAYAWHHIQSG